MTFDRGIFDLQPRLEKCHWRSKVPRSNFTVVKCPTVKHHWRSKVPWSNVTCGQVFLILVASQKSRGQMSLAVKCPAVKCHLWSNVPRSNVTAVKCPAVKCHLRSNVPWSNVTCGQMSHGLMSLGQMSQILEVVKSPWSNVLWSNDTVVIGDPLTTKTSRVLAYFSASCVDCLPCS